MSIAIEVIEVRAVYEIAAARPLDEAVWQAWVAKGRSREKRESAARRKVGELVAAAGLLVVAGLWPISTAHDSVGRIAAALGAVGLMWDGLRARR